MYPRNVTCYLALRQKTVPTCKHAMISVRQESEQKSSNYLTCILATSPATWLSGRRRYQSANTP
ncbi:hypothetical protein J6590_008210 [Homalodisca vitripennis]|nr:hypothetical protein J6590_008210 [Homalodisca vitripennis]